MNKKPILSGVDYSKLESRLCDYRTEELIRFVNRAPTPEKRRNRKAMVFGYLYSGALFPK